MIYVVTNKYQGLHALFSERLRATDYIDEHALEGWNPDDFEIFEQPLNERITGDLAEALCD